MSAVISIQADDAVTNTCSGSILRFCSLSEAASPQQESISRNFFPPVNIEDGYVDLKKLPASLFRVLWQFLTSIEPKMQYEMMRRWPLRFASGRVK